MILLILVVISIPMMIFTWHVTKADIEGEVVYYSATEVTSDGNELTDEGVKEQLGIKNVSFVMSLILKDSGDCGIFMIDQGALGTWKENDDGITLNALPEKLSLKDEWGKLVFETEYNDRNIRIVLERMEKMPSCFADYPEYTFGFKYSSKDTEALNSFMLDGIYCISGNTLYGKFFNEKGESALGYSKIKSGKEPKLDKAKILVSGGNAKFITKVKDNLYYLWATGGSESICRISEEGGDPEVLREGECDYVQVRFGRIYFTDAANRFCSMKTDGTDEKTVIDKAVFMPYVVDRNWMIYQDDADGERLHIGTVDGKYDAVITGERSYTWTISGRDMYFTSTADKTDAVKHKCRLHRLDTTDFKELADNNAVGSEAADEYMGDVFAVNRKAVFGGDGERVSLKEWKTIGNSLYGSSTQKLHMLYLSDRYIIRGSTDGMGNFSSIELKNLKSGKSCSIIK
ncbi:MAG: DUF5050 domain-containing protein [Clostridia bacterium]|nr:DUF5050 domain-containing protein [Clostridia bacterium]